MFFPCPKAPNFRSREQRRQSVGINFPQNQFTNNKILDLHNLMARMTRLIAVMPWPTLLLCSFLIDDGIAFHPVSPHTLLAFSPPRGVVVNTNLFSSNGGSEDNNNAKRLPSSNRREFFASSLISTGVLLGATADPALAAAATAAPGLPWEKDPINPKRSNVRVEDAESTYNLSFVTYLSRFLLSFDPYAQQWWLNKANEIPKSSSQPQTFAIRKEQFGDFAASVELGLLVEFQGTEGPKVLLEKLLNRFCSRDVVISNNSDSDIGDDTSNIKLLKREKREAKRQIALLFGLLSKTQPTKELTELLASIDNGSIEAVDVDQNLKNLGGYTTFNPPELQFPPPQAGEGERATGNAILRPTGKVMQVQVVNGGEGFTKSTIPITVPLPKNGGRVATATAKASNGKLTSIQVTDAGEGYGDEDGLELKIVAPSSNKPATVRLELEQEIVGVILVNAGSGYAVEKSLTVSLVGKNGELSPIGTGYPKADVTSFQAYRNPGENQVRNFERKLDGQAQQAVLAGTASGGTLPPTPFAGKASSSQQLLALFPEGFGLEYDSKLKRYVLSVDPAFQQDNPILAMQGTTNRPLIPDFGPRGRSPIERNMELTTDTLLRFCLSGAICSSGVHLALTPLDVTKTKLQINPEKYPTFVSSFKTILKEDGPGTFFTGWLPTVTGNFGNGAILYALTETIRRSLTETAGMNAASLEVPIILAAAGTAAAAGACFYCPFEVVRIRTVAQPDYGSNSVAVLNRMVSEEGIGSLISAIPVFLVKQVPYAMTKFTIFDLSSEYLYRTFPAAQEDITLSLGVSLLCGVLGGVSAAIVSNPADTVIAELKKAKSDQTPQEALQALLDRAGVSALFKGLSVRMVFYSLTAALQFMVYDGVRFALGVGPDDLKLYLDVLGGALAEKGTIV